MSSPVTITNLHPRLRPAHKPLERVASRVFAGERKKGRADIILATGTSQLKTLDALKSPAGRAVMIGDTAADIGAGKAAGTVTVGVTYGYGSREEVAGAGPDLLIDSAAELLEHIL